MNMKEMKEKTAKHLRKHKEAYIAGAIAGGSCLLIGAAGGAVVMVRKPDVAIAQKIQALMNWKPMNIANTIVNIEGPPLGKPGIRMLCLENKTPYGSINEAARELHLDRGLLSAHLRNEIPDVNGKHFLNLGPAPVPAGATSPVAA